MSEDANRQDMSVHDSPNPSLAPTVEAQMSRVERVVVPPPSYTDPSNPAAASGSLNMQVDTHPSDISDDYGRNVQLDTGEIQVPGVIDVHSLDMQQVVTGEDDGSSVILPDNREEWQKKHWRQQAETLGLAVSGNTDTLKERVEDYEAAVEQAKNLSAAEWKDEIDGANSGDDLASVRQLYNASGADYSTVEDAFAAKQAELDGA